ncbi:MAG: ABC transporter permease subunit [Sedimentisphaerales bacterium]|jgi:ABC-type transport system involved in multi-copper enzyme maturation permease subunit|nr:ABC transporter permease subunit [Sedimentisphaerales bacterium]HNY77488.1 ABC transporter permease subunit [Sedimentisphaerales bacterium]HOC62892.1 ABC transporter permease subunit [Sedimentisphaerales bacterium]HOH63622.1 ABC transporter permease subunit [Sedimentisphaerales bacterium]HPY49249.1 ABC transporter permease subunit [Sedimentisphaerales bacterium]
MAPKRWAPTVSLSWLTGPIFDKELRVSSRRRRNYVLRFVYVVFFLVFAGLIWMEEMPSGAGSVYQVSRMGRAAQQIVVSVVWFQFIASQAVAIVMLSTAISDEIYNKTLGLLMTTPISSFQIVIGKLLSKLLQLALLLAITLPLLAITRVLGGVPWGYLVGGLCVTLSTALFCGALSLFFSIFTRKAYAAIITTAIMAAVWFGLVPGISIPALHNVISERAITDALCRVNPYCVLVADTIRLMTGQSISSVHWTAHCGVSLAGSALLLFWATVFVRKAALRQAVGWQPQVRRTWGWHRSGLDAERHPPLPMSIGTLEAATRRSLVRRVTGSPIFWKERRSPLLGRLGLGKIVIGIVLIALAVLAYVSCARHNMLSESETQVAYVVVFFALGTLFAAVLPATCITSEKESRSWPILLTTPISDRAILWGKFLGAVRQCSIAWLPLFAHVGLFTALGTIRPIGVVQLAVVAAWLTVFLCATGLYFTSRLARTTTAVIANVSLAAGLWALLPLFLAIVDEVFRIHGRFPSVYADTNPFVHAIVITDATARRQLHDYNWMQDGMRRAGEATKWILLNGALYVVIGLGFLARARARLRRNPV